jgi:hypothetical protein
MHEFGATTGAHSKDRYSSSHLPASKVPRFITIDFLHFFASAYPRADKAPTSPVFLMHPNRDSWRHALKLKRREHTAQQGKGVEERNLTLRMIFSKLSGLLAKTTIMEIGIPT